MLCRKSQQQQSSLDYEARIRASISHDKPGLEQRLAMSKQFWMRMASGISMSLMGTGIALAGNGFGQTALNVGTNLADFGGLMQSGFYLSGFGLVGWGIHTMRKAHKEEGQGKAKMSHGALETLFGAGLIAVPTFAGHAVNTMLGNITIIVQVLAYRIARHADRTGNLTNRLLLVVAVFSLTRPCSIMASRNAQSFGRLATALATKRSAGCIQYPTVWYVFWLTKR